MPINPSTFSFREALTSAKHSRQTLEQTWPGRLIFHFIGEIDTDVDDDLIYFGWYLFNPAKQINDRLRIETYTPAAGAASTFEYSLDSGATWTSFTPSSAGVPATVLLTGGGDSSFATTQLQVATIDLSGIVTTHWIGVRFDHDASIFTTVTFNVKGMLYNAANSPF